MKLLVRIGGGPHFGISKLMNSMWIQWFMHVYGFKELVFMGFINQPKNWEDHLVGISAKMATIEEIVM